MGPWPLGGAEGDERSHISGSPLTSREISWDRRGTSGAQRRAQQLVRDRQDRVRPTQIFHTTALLAPA